MESNTLVELAPHYLAMLLLVFLVLAVVRTLVGDLGFWIEVVIIFVVVFLYRPGVKRLGVAPSAWEN
jgi:uncharacterized membrane protein YdbT with pleckstrin-like domain